MSQTVESSCHVDPRPAPPAGSAADASAAAPGYSPEKQALIKRLNRIEGQIRGIRRMVEEDTYCIDVLTQISAVNAALHKVSLGLVEGHISHCVVGAAQESAETGDPSIVADKVAEASAAIGRLLR